MARTSTTSVHAFTVGVRWPRMPTATESPRLNWDVFIQCKECGTCFKVLRPEPSEELLECDDGVGRMILLDVPNACPECHNIRKVGS